MSVIERLRWFAYPVRNIHAVQRLYYKLSCFLWDVPWGGHLFETNKSLMDFCGCETGDFCRCPHCGSFNSKLSKDIMQSIPRPTPEMLENMLESFSKLTNTKPSEKPIHRRQPSDLSVQH